MFTVLVVLAQLFVKSFISVADNGFEDYPFLVVFLIIVMIIL